MFTGQFWKETATNVVKQFATVVVAFLIVDGAVVQQSVTSFNWGHILGIAMTAALATIALSLATGTPSTPGLVARKNKPSSDSGEAGQLCVVVGAVAAVQAVGPVPIAVACSTRLSPTVTGWRIPRMNRRCGTSRRWLSAVRLTRRSRRSFPARGRSVPHRRSDGVTQIELAFEH